MANFGYKAKGVYLHSVAWKLTNGWVRSGHHVIPFSDRDVARWSGFLGHRKWGIAPANRSLREVAEATRPDVLVLGHADVIWSSTIDRIRKMLPGIKVIQWNIDPLFEGNEASSEDNRRRLLSKINVVDATFVTTPGEPLKIFVGRGCPVVGFMPNPVDRSIERHRTFEVNETEFDLFFAAGSGNDTRFHCGAHRHVDSMCQEISARLPDTKFVWAGVLGRPHAFGPAYDVILARTRMGLNISRRNDVYLYSSERLAHYVGSGLLTFIDRASGYGDIFGDDELIFYSTEDELVDSIKRYSIDREGATKIARRGWQHYYELFDSRTVASYMLNATLGLHKSTDYSWPTLVS